MKWTAFLVALLLPLVGAAQTVRGFTDQDYERVLRTESRVLFYSFSPSMPLSIDGLSEIRRAAAILHATLVPLADPGSNPREILAIGDPQIRIQRSGRLRDQGIQLHYPSVVVSDNHKVVGRPIQGFKTHAGYVTLVSDLLKLPWAEEFEVTHHVALPRKMNMFFKPAYGTDLIVSGTAVGGNYLLNLRTRAVFNISGSGDPGPTPDGQFVTLLNSAGLHWYSVIGILSGEPRELIWDPGLHTYQSLGQLSPSRYRVLGALSSSSNPAGLIVRDYDVSFPDGSVTPETEWRPVCDGRQISIPMLSKTGELLSGVYEGSLRVFRIGVRATDCDEVFDTKLVTGKADFSGDDRSLLFVARAERTTENEVDAVFLADLHESTVRTIYFGTPAAQLAFPGFISPDEIVVYDATDKELLTLERIRKILP